MKDKKQTITKPFFIFNPKSFLYGKELLDLAKTADALAEIYSITIGVTAPYADIPTIANETNHILVIAQHLDGIKPGRGMGHVLPDSLYNAGARAAFLNHAEHPMTFSELVAAVERTEDLGMISIVCADSIKEARAFALLNPDVILCEPTDLIGTGKVSDESYIKQTNEAIKEINSNVLIMQAAGITTADDVSRTIALGADGTGCTSGIVKADIPSQMLKDMIEAVAQVKNL